MTAHAPRRVLVILGLGGAGDAVRITPCLSALREGLPEADLVLLAPERAVPVFEHSSIFRRIVVSRLYDLKARTVLGKRLEKYWLFCRLYVTLGRGYDLVITLFEGSRILNVLARLVGRRRVGFANAFPRFLSVNSGRYDAGRDPNDQCRALLTAAGIPPRRFAKPVPIHNDEDAAVVKRLLVEQGIAGRARLVVLHPGSDWACQQWLQDRWAILSDLLVERYGADLIFTGLADERAYIEAIRAQLRVPSTNLAGRTTLPQLGALIAHAQGCITVDCVAYELAQAGGIATVVLAGPSPAERSPAGVRPPVIVNRTAPELRFAINESKATKWIVNWRCLNYECPMAGLRDIAVADVLHAVEVQGMLGPKDHARVLQGAD